MDALARSLRWVAKLRLRALQHATIKDIPTERFNQLVEQLISSGWRKSYEYAGFDAWVDYGRIDLRKARMKLILEWDNWTEGSLEGPRSFVEGLGLEIGLPAVREWRWSDYDDAK